MPFAVSLTGRNPTPLPGCLPLLAKVPYVADLVGRPRRRLAMLLADRSYEPCRVVAGRGWRRRPWDTQGERSINSCASLSSEALSSRYCRSGIPRHRPKLSKSNSLECRSAYG